MARNNRYAKRSKISEQKFKQLLELFSYDLTAVQIAGITGLNRNTVNRSLVRLKLTKVFLVHDV